MNYAMTLAAGLVPAATPAAPAARKRLDAYRGKPQPSSSSRWWPWASPTFSPSSPTGGRVRSNEATLSRPGRGYATKLDHSPTRLFHPPAPLGMLAGDYSSLQSGV